VATSTKRVTEHKQWPHSYLNLSTFHEKCGLTAHNLRGVKVLSGLSRLEYGFESLICLSWKNHHFWTDVPPFKVWLCIWNQRKQCVLDSALVQNQWYTNCNVM